MERHIRLSQPWTELVLCDGWHQLSVLRDGECAVVTFNRHDTGSAFDISIKAGAPAFMKLSGGAYKIRAMDSLRYPNDLRQEVLIKRLSWSERALFFASKFMESLRRGEGIEKLCAKVLNAINSRTGFGAQGYGAKALTDAPFEMGMLSLKDRNERDDIPRLMGYGPRLKSIEGKVHFLISALGEGEALEVSLAAQLFQTWSYSDQGIDLPPKGIVLKLVTERSATLTPDALLLMAEAAISSPDIQIIYADVWYAEQATAKFGFDPMIHKSLAHLGYPVAIRMGPGDADEDPDISGMRAEQFARISVPVASCPHAPQISYTPLPIPAMAEDAPITAIVPTRDRADLLRECVSGLLHNTRGLAQIIIIDNGSVEAETLVLLDELRALGVEVLRDEGDFNFSRLCNLGAQHARTKILAFINNDIKVIRPDWLVNMTGWATQPEVGAVGTRLLYEDGTLQHGGLALGLSGCAGHLFRGADRAVFENIPSLALPSLRMAVTAAALVVEKTKFDAVKGFDEAYFKVTLNDIDLCLKLRAQGWLTVYEPRAEAYHLEGKSRGNDESPDKVKRRNAEIVAFESKWRAAYADEVWFSPALSISHEMPRLL